MTTPAQPLPIDLALSTSVKKGGAPLGSYKKELGDTWRRSTRSVGGFWLGTAMFAGEDFQKLEIFLDYLGCQIRETLGGVITWAGFLSEMTLTVGGLQYVRRWADIANRVQAIYTRLGDNLLTNGSAESGNWTVYGAGTLAQSSAWVSDGANSEHVTGGANDGATIQTGIAIVDGKAYELQATVNLVTGTWRLEVYRTDTGARLGATDENSVGQKVMRTTIPDTNTYAGNVGVRFYCTAGPGDAYADGASFREAAQQARTSWLSNAGSQLEYGTLETALLLAGMSDSAANAQAATYLARQAFPRTIAPGDYSPAMAGDDQGISLALTFAGHVFTLRNKYVARPATTQNASIHVTNLIADSEFVTAGNIQANAMQWQLEDRAPLRVWEVLRDITKAGDTTGARWNCGVYDDARFEYGPAGTAVDYHYQGGGVSDVNGSVIDPWLVRPGLMYLDDMPAGPGALTANAADDPHVLFIEEVEFSAADWLAGQPGFSFRREAGADAV